MPRIFSLFHIKTSIETNITINSLQLHCTIIKTILNNYSLSDILTGDFDKLLEIKKSINLSSTDFEIIKTFFNYDKANSKDFIPLLSKLQPKIWLN